MPYDRLNTHYEGPINNYQLTGCFNGCQDFPTLEEALAECELSSGCRGVSLAPAVEQATGPLGGWGWVRIMEKNINN